MIFRPEGIWTGARVWTKTRSREGCVLFVGADQEGSLEQACIGTHRDTMVQEVRHNHGEARWLWRDNLHDTVQGQGSGPRVSEVLPEGGGS